MPGVSTPIPDPRLGEVVGGRWKLTGVVGRGGMGTVYVGEWGEQRGAIKVLGRGLTSRSSARHRFSRESGILRGLQHPAFPRWIDASEPGASEPFLVVELLQGETLEQALERDLPPPAEALRIAEAVLGGLAALHDAGFVHRDVKPSNIFLTDQGHVKLLDLGLARPPERVEGPSPLDTQLGVALGTVAYMAPEQARGDWAAISPATDVFAVGATLYHLLTGRPIRQAGGETSLLFMAASEGIPLLSATAPALHPEVAEVVDLALRFVPSSRYPSALTMLRDVSALRRGEPPPHAWERRGESQQETLRPAPGAPATDSRLPGACQAGWAAQFPELASGQVLQSVARDAAAPDKPSGDVPTAPGPGFPEPEARAAGRVGSVLAERYRLDALIGSGAMGSVYRASHVHMRNTVALKVLHRELTHRDEVVARFEREAIAAARIDHRNVATAKDFGSLDDGSFYLVLEYIEGRSLREALASEARLEPRAALTIARQIAAALEAAHAAGVVHRDLKPDNVMLLSANAGVETVKVLDFGIAKLRLADGAGPVLTQVGTVFGTPEYMSPEQAAGKAVDERCDLYSLGVMLYEMLFGVPPFTHEDLLALLTAHLTEPAPPLPQEFLPELRELVAALLEKSPERRPSSATEVAVRLDGLLESYGARARLPSWDGATEGSFLSASHSTVGVSPDTTARTLLEDDAPCQDARSKVGDTTGAPVGSHRSPRWRGRLRVLTRGLGAAIVVGLLAYAAVSLRDQARRQQRIEAARAGDSEAFQWLIGSEGPAVLASEWRDLGVALTRSGSSRDALAAFDRCLAARPELVWDPLVVSSVRSAIDSPHGARALQLAAHRMGALGADLIYETKRRWASERRKRQRELADRARVLLSQRVVLRHASASLKLLLALEEARRCSEFKALLPTAARVADARALPRLGLLAQRSGGGLLGLQDRFKCLRGGHELANALERARATPGPRFDSLSAALPSKGDP